VGGLEHRRGDDRIGEESDGSEEDAEDGVGDGQGRREHGEGLAEQDLHASDGGDEERFEGALLAFADDRVGGQRRRDDPPG